MGKRIRSAFNESFLGTNFIEGGIGLVLVMSYVIYYPVCEIELLEQVSENYFS